MIRLLCILLPPILFVLLLLPFRKEKRGLLQQLKRYFAGTLLVNISVILVLIIIFHRPLSSLNEATFSTLFAVKYVAFALCFVIFYVIAYMLLFVKVKIVNRDADKAPKWWKVLRSILVAICLFLIFFIFFGCRWMENTFGLVSLNEMIFTLSVPIKGTDPNHVYTFITQVLLWVILCTTICILILTIIKKKKLVIAKDWKSEKKDAAIYKWLTYGKIAIVIPVILIALFSVELKHLGFSEDLKNLIRDSNFIQNNYVEPSSANLTFPQEQRNLIYIILESMENTCTSVETGGIKQIDLIPELTKFAQDHLSFSNSEKIGGALEVPGATWTSGAMVAQTAGIPILVPLNGNYFGEQAKAFLPGAYSIGQILEKQGYGQYLIIGSDAHFGGRGYYYQQHGNYQIYDYVTAISEAFVPEDYHEWWGLEDSKLYDYAKTKINEIAQKDEPFNITLLTTDTHFPNGFVCSLCGDTYDQPFDNVLACASRQVESFISWLSEQSFYDNTTIIIVGDHLSMDANYYADVPVNYVRSLYNTIINPAIQPINTKNRQFCSFDLYPTTLAAMGIEIEGDRLALGTNLFSETPTLLEEFGTDYVFGELQQNSNFYNRSILY